MKEVGCKIGEVVEGAISPGDVLEYLKRRGWREDGGKQFFELTRLVRGREYRAHVPKHQSSSDYGYLLYECLEVVSWAECRPVENVVVDVLLISEWPAPAKDVELLVDCIAQAIDLCEDQLESLEKALGEAISLLHDS